MNRPDVAAPVAHILIWHWIQLLPKRVATLPCEI